MIAQEYICTRKIIKDYVVELSNLSRIISSSAGIGFCWLVIITETKAANCYKIHTRPSLAITNL